MVVKPNSVLRPIVSAVAKNERHHARTHAGEECLHTGVFQQITQHCRNEQNNDKRGEHHAQSREQTAQHAALRRSDERRHVDGKRPGVDSDTAMKLMNSLSVSQ